MKTILYTPEQLAQFKLIQDHTRFQALLRSGILFDLLDSHAQLTNRIAVRQALGLGVLPSKTELNVLNLSLGLDGMISVGNYDFINQNITSDNFPIVGDGQLEFEEAIFHFERSVSSEDAIVKIIASNYENPWEPAKIENLLAYGAKNPEDQRKYPIIGLGSVININSSRCVPCLLGSNLRRSLDLGFFDGGWGDFCRFLAVRKVLRPLGA